MYATIILSIIAYVRSIPAYKCQEKPQLSGKFYRRKNFTSREEISVAVIRALKDFISRDELMLLADRRFIKELHLSRYT